MKLKPIKTMTSELPNSERVGGKMRGRTTIRVSGSLRGLLLSSFVPLAGIASTVGNVALAQDAAASCAPVVGRVVSLQGNVEVQRAGTPNWLKVGRLDTSICAGDRLRTDALSRAALFVQPETLVRVDQNTTISISQTTAEVLVEFHADEVSQAAQKAQSCGAGYFITRFPRKFKVSTPHMNAAVEGTEFMVESSCKASTLTVFEGQVLSESLATQESRSLTAGQRLETGPAMGTSFSTVVRPADAVQWVLRYPPLSDATTEAEISTAEQCKALPESRGPSCLAERAEVLLRLGRVDQALQDIDQAIAVNATDSNANALRAIIQVTKNDKAAALESAGRAVAADQLNYRAWLALSYAQQASFELEQALESARKAQVLQADSSVIHARVAELLLSLGYAREAEKSAYAAIAANPAESNAHSVLGFVWLAQVRTEVARSDFETAIARDSFASLPRLGLGLALIREGQLAAGREQLEIAVALDPGNAILRSYVGKAYYEENTKERNELAAAQFALAKQLDSNDPTPSFYDAILRQSENRPVEALHELDASIAKNDNRAVYRSRLLLDDDAAARNASVAAIYGSLGFEKLAILESTKALADNPGNHSAHRQLATAYANIPRHEIARVSEALQAQIRQPVSSPPVDPLLATDSLLILRDAGPSQVGANEFSLLFNQNKIQGFLDGIVGDRDTLGNQAVLSGLADRFSFALSQLHFETDGFVENDSAEKTVYDVLLHGQVSDAASVQIDLKRSELEVGQTFFPFDPDLAEQDTISEEGDSVRLSGYYLVNPGNNWILSTSYEDRNRAISTFPDDFVFTTTDSTTWSVEIQNLLRFGDTQIVAGAGHIEESDDFEIEQEEIDVKATNLYVYSQWTLASYDLTIQAGLAAELFESRNSSFANPLERERISPKFGVVWSPRTGTTVRAAAYSSVRRPFIRSQTIEPTQVSGFNQFFTGFEQFFGDRLGSISDRIGLAIDQTLPRDAAIGGEIAKRRLTVPSFIDDGDFTWREATAHLYLYKTFLQRASSGWQAASFIEGEFEEIKRPPDLTGPEGIVKLTTLRAPVGLRFFNSNGFTVRLATSYVEQEGTFSADPIFGSFRKKDDAWIADLSVEFRMPKRLGSFILGANNLTDDFIDLLEIDPLNPRVATRRLVFARFRLNF